MKADIFQRMLLLFSIFLVPLNNLPIDNAHFYRSCYFGGEPRFEKEILTSFEVTLAGGTSDKGLNIYGKKRSVLDIYGYHNMHLLGKNVPSSTPEVDTILNDLSSLQLSHAHHASFGQLSFFSKFRMIEANVNLYQNLIKGFFFQFSFPIRSLKFDNICYSDLSPPTSTGTAPNTQTPEWLTFLEKFNTVINAYHLSFNPYVNSAGLGDAALILGWTMNFEKTTHLDFIDATFRSGVLFPSGKRKNEDILFDVPLGYNGHLGIPLRFDFALGYFEWLTFGGHAQALFFSDLHHNIRMKTDMGQSGQIKLTKGWATTDKGSLWDLGLYSKADHFIKGLSLLFGYSYNKKDRDFLCPSGNGHNFSAHIVNSDLTLHGWRMHTLHFLLEYDFTKRDNLLGPRLALLFNVPIKRGKQIMLTTMYGANFGLEVSWDF